MNDHLYDKSQRLFIGVWSTGIQYCDRYVEEHGDYKKLAFLPYRTLELEVRPDCPVELRAEIEADAQSIIRRRGEQFPISAGGQYVTLGK